MPRIDHVALWMSDLNGMCSFHASAFSAKVSALYENPSKGFASRFLTFEDGARLEFMTTSAFNPPKPEPGVQRIGLTHLAISLGSEPSVDELTGRLRAAGVSVLDGPRRTGDGYYESVVLVPEGNRIELTA